jgi:hypothetical protein
MARIPTNADAQSTTVTATAATPRALVRPGDAGGAADVAEFMREVVAMLPI